MHCIGIEKILCFSHSRCALMARLLRLKQPTELLHVTTGFIKKEVKPVQIALPQSLLGLVVLHTGDLSLFFSFPRQLLSISLLVALHQRFAEFWNIKFGRAKLDDNAKLLEFTEKLEAACIGVVESGKMTKDLALIIHGSK